MIRIFYRLYNWIRRIFGIPVSKVDKIKALRPKFHLLHMIAKDMDIELHDYQMAVLEEIEKKNDPNDYVDCIFRNGPPKLTRRQKIKHWWFWTVMGNKRFRTIQLPQVKAPWLKFPMEKVKE